MGKINSLSECNASNEVYGAVYDFFKERSDDFGPVDIIKTPYKSRNSPKTDSDNSFSFLQNDGESVKECVERIFDVSINVEEKK